MQDILDNVQTLFQFLVSPTCFIYIDINLPVLKQPFMTFNYFFSRAFTGCIGGKEKITGTNDGTVCISEFWELNPISF